MSTPSLTAIVTKIRANLSAIAGADPDGIAGPWMARAPEGTDMPYIVITEISNTPETHTTHGQADAESYQISVRDTTPELTSAHRDLVRAQFDRKDLTLVGAGIKALRTRVGEHFLIEEDHDVWHAAITVDILQGTSNVEA